MLFLLFQLGDDRYALPTEQVVEVLPRVRVKAMPGAPAGVAGVFNYHGDPVPLIDLSAAVLQRPARPTMSTRIVLVNYRVNAREQQPVSEEENSATDSSAVESHLLGLLVEEVTTTIKRRPEEFEDAGVATDGAPYLGPVTTDESGIIQWVEVDLLLPNDVRDALFRDTLESD